MKPYLPILIALALLCPTGHGAPVVFDSSDLNDIQAARATCRLLNQRGVPLISVPHHLVDAYDVPICRESHPFIGRGTNGLDSTTVQFVIIKEQPLDRSLDKLVDLFNGLLEYRIIHNQIVILPAKQTDDEIVSNLDVRVSVDFEDVSVWEALKEIVKAINRQQMTPYPVLLYLEDVNKIEPLLPLPDITDIHEITLSMENITAREAICAVLATSPVKMAYQYSTGSTSDGLGIHIYREDTLEAKTMTEKQIQWWRRETGLAGLRRIPLGREDMLLESTDDYVAHLGLRISVDLEAVSVWEAFKQIVAEVNKQTGYIQPLGVLPEDLRYNESPVPELTELREITLSMQDVTVQEALDTVVAASSLEISYAYEWLITMSTLTIITLEDGQYREEADPLTQEERAWWLRERGLRQKSEDPPVWILRPPGMDTSFEHHSNGQLIPIPNAAIQKE